MKTAQALQGSVMHYVTGVPSLFADLDRDGSLSLVVYDPSSHVGRITTFLIRGLLPLSTKTFECVKLRGIPDPVTGMVYDLHELKKNIQTVFEAVDHKHLDKDVEWFQHHVSTSENVAIYLWEKLRVQMKTPKVLYKVTVEETPKNIFTYKGEI